MHDPYCMVRSILLHGCNAWRTQNVDILQRRLVDPQQITLGLVLSQVPLCIMSSVSRCSRLLPNGASPAA